MIRRSLIFLPITANWVLVSKLVTLPIEMEAGVHLLRYRVPMGAALLHGAEQDFLYCWPKLYLSLLETSIHLPIVRV